jgi:hypothetical protein
MTCFFGAAVAGYPNGHGAAGGGRYNCKGLTSEVKYIGLEQWVAECQGGVRARHAVPLLEKIETVGMAVRIR